MKENKEAVDDEVILSGISGSALHIFPLQKFIFIFMFFSSNFANKLM